MADLKLVPSARNAQRLSQLLQVIIIDKMTLEAFALKERVESILKSYPKEFWHYPNTVVPEYSIVTHSKFEVNYSIIVRVCFVTGQE